METTGPIHFLNVAYFFRLLYETVFGVSGGDYTVLLHQTWAILSTVAYAVSFVGLGVLIYSTMRIFETAKKDEDMYTTVAPDVEDAKVDRSRWSHVLVLIESTQESDWRQAILEADIMLDEELLERGFVGETVADKLKQIPPGRLASLQDAWDAHRIRNDIAHRGSEISLDAHAAYRTISRYKNVFEEFGTI